MGRALLVNNVVFFCKGINYSPIPLGSTDIATDQNFRDHIDVDAPLMAEAGINCLRPYVPFTNTSNFIYTLDVLHNHSIYVINSVYTSGNQKVAQIETLDHPTIIMNAVGNEFNYNGLYYWNGCPQECFDRVREAVSQTKTLDPSRPVTIVYGELPSSSIIEFFDNVDIWSINLYRNASFTSLFTDFSSLSSKPLLIGEYGADSYDTSTDGVNEAAQAYAVETLTHSLVDNWAGYGRVCLGGLLFEFNDEWWKCKSVTCSVSTHDSGGVAPGGGPYPDLVFNEEHWGIVTLNRTKKLAYYALKDISIPAVDFLPPSPPPPPYSPPLPPQSPPSPPSTPSCCSFCDATSCANDASNVSATKDGIPSRCAARIQWVIDNQNKTQPESCDQVGGESFDEGTVCESCSLT